MLNTHYIATTAPGIKKSLIKEGLDDYSSGLKLWRISLHLGWEDVRLRYVRTFLGPLWLIIGTGIWILAMGFVMASLFDCRVTDTLPFVATGTILWSFIANVMSDSCGLFIHSHSIIHSIRLPISVYVFRSIVRNFIIFAHNIIILSAVFIYCHVQINENTMFAALGLLIIILNAVWISTVLGIINTRFRDIQQIVTTSLSVLPFITPIYWERSFLKKDFWIANINPFYHAVEIIRAPLLGHSASLLSWEVMVGITLLGMLSALILLSKYKNRIIYWV